MTNSDKIEYINYRIEKAGETYQAALELSKLKFWNSCVNRLYYACFYAVNALLVNNELEVKTHNGVKTSFFQHFIKTGVFSFQYGQLYSDLFDWRLKGDYNDFFDLTEEDVKPLLPMVDSFLKIITKYISSKNH